MPAAPAAPPDLAPPRSAPPDAAAPRADPDGRPEDEFLDLGDGRRVHLSELGDHLGPIERPPGLRPRRYSRTMTEERKRFLEDSERWVNSRPPVPHVPWETLEEWIAEGRE